MSYLDDPNHDWSIQTETLRADESLRSMIWELRHPAFDEVAYKIILDGYAGLRQRHPEATPVECLHTSMLWYTG